MLNFGSWVAKICGRCGRHCLTMENTKGFLAKMTMFAGVDVSDVALLTRDKVKEFVFVVGRIEEECVEVELQDGKGWGFTDKSPLSL